MNPPEHGAGGAQANAPPQGPTAGPVIRMVHVVPGLAPGGAERLLLAWVEADAQRTAHLVLTLRPGGALTAPLVAAGAQVLALNGPRRLAEAIAAVRRHRPQTMVGWLHHGNAAALALHALAAPKARLCFSHHGGPHPPPGPWHRRVAQAVERLAWHWPHAHLYAARSSARWDAARGRSLRRAWVLPAGVDTTSFSPASAQRESLRRRLGLDEGIRLVGLLGRFDPAKDHATGLKAFFLRHAPSQHLLCMGFGMHPLPSELTRKLTPTQLPFLHSLPESIDDVAAVVASLDALLVCSRSESLPRVTLEAMACEVPCVTTDVGDVSALLGNMGWVAPIGDHDRLSRGLQWALTLPPSAKRRLESLRAVVQKGHAKHLLTSMGRFQ